MLVAYFSEKNNILMSYNLLINACTGCPVCPFDSRHVCMFTVPSCFRLTHCYEPDYCRKRPTLTTTVAVLAFTYGRFTWLNVIYTFVTAIHKNASYTIRQQSTLTAAILL